MASKVKKFRPKTHKGTTKRVKISNGGKAEGKLIIGRIGDNHRNIGKSRSRLLKARRTTTLGGYHKKLKKVMKTR
jgi:ribosomal protein L35